MAGSNKKLKKAVIAALSHRALKEINFDYNGCVVTSARFEVVRDLVNSDRIKCNSYQDAAKAKGVFQDGVVTVAEYVGTKYNARKLAPNQFIFPDADYGTKLVGFAAEYEDAVCRIIHEATHALFDTFKSGQDILAVDNEAAASLAAGLFSIISNFGLQTVSGGANAEGQALAEKILPQMRKAKGRTFTVTQSSQGNLLDAVKSDYNLVGNELDTMDGT
jgi:hypothetical protein